MRTELLGLLACPECGGELTVDGTEIDGELHEGALRCGGCGTVLPVAAGIPRAAASTAAQVEVGEAFSSQWQAYERGAFEPGTIYGRSDESLWAWFKDATGISEPALTNLVVLDAGCGPARISRQIAERGATAVVALDVSDAVDGVYAETRELSNLHPLQADLTAAPLRAAFDLVWSMGVIHHTGDAAGAFRALTRYVRPGGLLFVWVYPRSLLPFHWANATQWVQAGLSRLGLRRLPDSVILRLAGALSYPTVALHRLYRAARRLPGLRPRTPFARESVRPLTRRAFHIVWYDALVPPHTSWHGEQEVIDWFEAAGFTDIAVASGRRLGVRGRAPLACQAAPATREQG